MKASYSLLFSLAACCSLACLHPAALASAQDKGGDQHVDAGAAKMVRSSDVKFADDAARGGMSEVELGKLATEKATSPDVKAFGQMMIDDHTKANEQLKSIAEKENMTLPTNLTSKDQALKAKLAGLSGNEFDQAYIKAMVKDHQEDVKEFQKEANAGKDPQVKEFASQTLPILQTHLEKAKAAEATLTGKSGK